jgi:hypothetical protein
VPRCFSGDFRRVVRGWPENEDVRALFRETTRFGAPARPVEAPSGVLRARAAATGVVLRHAPPVDLLASAVVADAWCALHGGARLEDARLQDEASRRVLAAALARSAGYPGPLVEVPLDDVASAPEWLRLADEHRAWVHELCPDAPGQVLMRAGSDLYAAGPGTRCASYGALLQLLAGDWE